MPIFPAISWVAVAIGFAGTWVAGRKRQGWLIGIASSALWIAYDVERRIWAGTFAAVIAIFLCVRNYRCGRPTARRDPHH